VGLKCNKRALIKGLLKNIKADYKKSNDEDEMGHTEETDFYSSPAAPVDEATPQTPALEKHFPAPLLLLQLVQRHTWPHTPIHPKTVKKPHPAYIGTLFPSSQIQLAHLAKPTPPSVNSHLPISPPLFRQVSTISHTWHMEKYWKNQLSHSTPWDSRLSKSLCKTNTFHLWQTSPISPFTPTTSSDP
jgi:hypothetical protein